MRQIALDGPAGAGKSTIAKEISKKLNFMYVDTGAMYRTIALYCINKNADLDDEELISKLCMEAPIKITYEDGVQHMYLEGEDVSNLIRTEQVSKAASDISKFGAVRTRLVAMQQELGNEYNVIMDGRDIGTVVLPNASLKIFLTASSTVRAQRRCNEYKEKGLEADFEAIKKDIEQRDYNDSHRAISPLMKADDAIEVDTSNMNIDEVVNEVIKLYEKVK